MEGSAIDAQQEELQKQQKQKKKKQRQKEKKRNEGDLLEAYMKWVTAAHGISLPQKISLSNFSDTGR